MIRNYWLAILLVLALSGCDFRMVDSDCSCWSDGRVRSGDFDECKPLCGELGT